MNKIVQAKLDTLPTSPGVYFHKSATGEIIYIGKAAVLRNRVRQYFQASRNLDAKTMALVAEIADIDWQETESEVDALFLESEMVKRYMPRYNILLRDDKSQSFVRIDMKSEWPTVSLTRNPSDDGAEYIGPFYNSFALKKALRYLRRAFPYFSREPKKTDSKLELQIGLTPDKNLGSEVYKKSLRQLMSYLRGNRKKIVHDLEGDMKQAAADHKFETAAHLRNQLQSLKELQRRVLFGDREFLDISKDRALESLAEILQLKSPPRRIEGFDISHQGGKNVVASMVVFTNGVSDRAEYRKFKVSETNDDYANMKQVLTRRLSPKNLKSWGTPDLILIDGGKGQLQAAIDAQKDTGTQLPVISVAKRNEEILVKKQGSHIGTVNIKALMNQQSPDIYVQELGDFYSLNLHPGVHNASGHSKNLRGNIFNTGSYKYEDIVKLFQRIRDESHRFAISYHEVIKRKNQIKTGLEDIPGIGPKTRQKLQKKFGGINKIKQASYDDLAAIVGKAKAQIIKSGTIET